MSFGLNQINGYLRKGLHLERFDPSRRLIELRIWIYAGIGFIQHINYLSKTYVDINIKTSAELNGVTKLYVLKC